MSATSLLSRFRAAGPAARDPSRDALALVVRGCTTDELATFDALVTEAGAGSGSPPAATLGATPTASRIFLEPFGWAQDRATQADEDEARLTIVGRLRGVDAATYAAVASAVAAEKARRA